MGSLDHAPRHTDEQKRRFIEQGFWNDDTLAISQAAGRIDPQILDVTRIHGILGAKAKAIQEKLAQMEDSGTMAEIFLSEARDLDFAAAFELFCHQLVLVLVVARIGGLAALAQAVQRRQGQVEMAGFDQPVHFPIEEGHQQRGDVRAIDIGVGHDDDPLVA